MSALKSHLGKIIAITTVYTCFLGRYNEPRDGILLSCDDCRSLLLAPLQRSVMVWCVVFGRPLLSAFICAGKGELLGWREGKVGREGKGDAYFGRGLKTLLGQH